jgi:Na+-driven multidrug efflux pump
MVMFVPLAAVQITGATYFQAIGKATESMVLGLSRQFFILIPLILLFPRSSVWTVSGWPIPWPI